MQVEYLQAGAPLTWLAGAPAVDTAGQLNYNSLITQVRVTLAARSEARNIQGMTTAASAQDAIRGSLTSTAAVRSALYNLAASPRPAAATGTTWK